MGLAMEKQKATAAVSAKTGASIGAMGPDFLHGVVSTVLEISKKAVLQTQSDCDGDLETFSEKISRNI